MLGYIAVGEQAAIMASMADPQIPAVGTGLFNYMADSAKSSLYRNGKVLTRRNRDGSDARWEGVDLEERQMPVANARALAAQSSCTLTTSGFEMRLRPLARQDLNFLDHEQVVRLRSAPRSFVKRAGPVLPRPSTITSARRPASAVGSASRAASRFRGPPGWSMATTR